MKYAPVAALAFACCVTQCPQANAITHADGAKILATQLHLKTNDDKKHLYGLFPGIWPGRYDGSTDFAYFDRQATLEHVVVAITRWAGWDTVSYDRAHLSDIAKYASPKGFPLYGPSPSPRSIPYIAAALTAGLISQSDLKDLQSEVDAAKIIALAQKADRIVHDGSSSISVPPTMQLPHLEYPTGEARLAVLKPGFRDYDKLDALPGRILDLAGPELRLFSPGSSLSKGKQGYFPLGPLETVFSAGLNVAADNLSHQSEAIYGVVENHSPTVNAVGVWGAAKSWEHDARVWGGFLTAESDGPAEKDAQLVGLEVDVTNNSLPGIAPNASKSGVQIVGIGPSEVSDAILIIGAGNAKWNNGINFASDAISQNGAVIGVSPGRPIARGIDMANVRFTDAAISLGKWSAITFRNTEGQSAAILTDDSNRLLIRTGKSGLRIINDKSELVVEITPDGDLITPKGRLSDLYKTVERLASVIDGPKK